jgi:hypothetical protein
MNKEKSLSEITLEKIEQNKIKMKSRFYFVIKIIALIFGIFLLNFIAILITSFAIFSMRQNGLFLVPLFGITGIKILFFYMPWFLILGITVLIIASEIFAEHFSFIYKKPILYSFLAIVVFVILGGSVINLTPLHENLLIRAEKGKPMLGANLYKEIGLSKIPDVSYGSVEEITEKGFKIKTIKGEELEIIVNRNSKIFNKDIKKRDNIIVLGEKSNQVINAINIKKVDQNKKFLPCPKKIEEQKLNKPGAKIEFLPKQI